MDNRFTYQTHKKLFVQYEGFCAHADLSSIQRDLLYYAILHIITQTYLPLNNFEQAIYVEFQEYQTTHDSEWICETCGALIKRFHNELICENGCFEDDIRNGISEDELEEHGIKDTDYPIDEWAE